MADEGLKALDAELGVWSDNDNHVQLFLRDDDAKKHTGFLERMTEICERNSAPLLLACIPSGVDASLVKCVSAHPILTPAVHGISHTNHAPADEKKCELGLHRDIAATMSELKLSNEKMQELFGTSLSSILVPPWNRIDDAIANESANIGFTAISGFGWKIREKAKALPWINTHVDIIDWRADKAGKSADRIAAELADCLKHSRETTPVPVGILTHHLEQDETAWAGLERVVKTLTSSGICDWLAADELIEDANQA